MLYSKRTVRFTFMAIAAGLIGAAVVEPVFMMDFTGRSAFGAQWSYSEPNSESGRNTEPVEFKAWLADSFEEAEVEGPATDLDSRSELRAVLVGSPTPER